MFALYPFLRVYTCLRCVPLLYLTASLNLGIFALSTLDDEANGPEVWRITFVAVQLSNV